MKLNLSFREFVQIGLRHKRVKSRKKSDLAQGTRSTIFNSLRRLPLFCQIKFLFPLRRNRGLDLLIVTRIHFLFKFSKNFENFENLELLEFSENFRIFGNFEIFELN